MPRWLVILGIVAAATLLVALLRYAIDLLGVVFLIILVGFSIRAVSDWLTEGESVSGWALGAVFGGLFGTVLVGLWLFGPRDMTTGALERGLPAPVLAVTDWLEAHGWGQRVLLSGGIGGSSAPSMPAPTSPLSTAAPSSGSAAPRAEPESRSSPASRASSSEASSPRERKGSVASGAEAATPSSAGASNPSTARRQPSPGGAREATGPPLPPPTANAEPPTAAPMTAAPPADGPSPVSTSTSTTVSSSHSTSPVGTSVRLTATVTGDGTGAPSGIVVFFDGDRAIGTAPVHGSGVSVTAVLSTLDLALGDHQITAQFQGTHGFQASRSQPITQTVTRK